MTPPGTDPAGLAAALHGDVAAWTGLPWGVRDEELSAVLGAGSPARSGRLSGQPVQWRDYPAAVRAFFDESGVAFLIWVNGLGDPARVNPVPAPLPAPEAELVGEGDRLSGTMQLVWASRGLTGYVTEGERSLVGVALYAPTTVDYYRTWLGAKEPSPYRPWRA